MSNPHRRSGDRSLSSSFSGEGTAYTVDDRAEAWTVTFADMMSLLLTFFILLLTLADFDPEKIEKRLKAMSEGFGGEGVDMEEKLTKNEEIYNELEKIIKDENLTQDVELTSDTRGIVLYANGGVLFKPGEAEFQEDAKYFLNGIAEVLRSSPNKILVEGHTDDTPTKTEKFPSNWELSAARAAAVIRNFIEKGGISPARCQAVGYAQYKPRFPPIPENRPRNRRVEVILLHDKF